MNLKTTLKSLLSEVDELEAFRKNDRREVLSILSQLQKHGEAINLFLNNGEQLILSHLLEINSTDNACYFLNSSPDVEPNLEGEVVCIATPGGGSLIKFTGSFTPWRYQGNAAFRAEIPASIIKLQRREYFRSKVPSSQTFSCLFQGTSIKPLRLAIHDLSIGGLSCWIPPDFALQLQLTQQHKISMELGQAGVSNTLIQVCSLRQIQEIVEHKGEYLLGGHFVCLDHPLEAKLQKLLSQLEMAQRTLR
jgi:flagellar brake protein